MEYLREKNMVCFALQELRKVFQSSKDRDFFKKAKERGYNLNDLLADRNKVKEIAEELALEGVKSKEHIEIFVALDTCFRYFNNKDSKVCFVLKNNVQKNNLKIEHLTQLIEVIEENTLTDFAIYSENLRQFQLKQYRGNIDTSSLFTFIEEKLKSYGNQLNDVNLFIIIRGNKPTGNPMEENKIDFRELQKRIMNLGLKSNTEVLISYNEENKWVVINKVYPELQSMKKSLSLASATWGI